MKIAVREATRLRECIEMRNWIIPNSSELEALFKAHLTHFRPRTMDISIECRIMEILTNVKFMRREPIPDLADFLNTIKEINDIKAEAMADSKRKQSPLYFYPNFYPTLELQRANILPTDVLSLCHDYARPSIVPYIKELKMLYKAFPMTVIYKNRKFRIDPYDNYIIKTVNIVKSNNTEAIKKIATKMEIKGRSKMNKSQLCQAIINKLMLD